MKEAKPVTMDRPIEKKSWPPRRLAGIALAAILAPFCVYAVLNELAISTLRVNAERLVISTVERGSFQDFIAVTGDVLPFQTIHLTAGEGGRVEEVFRQDGSLVEEGDPLLRLANTDLELDILRREDRLQEQENVLFNTRLLLEKQNRDFERRMAELDYRVLRQKRVFERDAALAKEQLVSELDFELSRDEFQFLVRQKELAREEEEENRFFQEKQIEQVEQSVSRMQANLALARDKLEKLLIRAPKAGQLTSLDAEIGQSKAPGERLGRLDVAGGFKVRAKIDQLYIARVEIGRKGTFDFVDKDYELAVTQIYPEVHEGRFEVDLDFAGEPPRGIKRGQTLHIRLELGDPSEARLLPRGAFFQKTGGRWAYVLDRSGKHAEKREIRLGRQNPDHFEILAGLEPGDRVVTSSYETLGEYDRIVLEP